MLLIALLLCPLLAAAVALPGLLGPRLAERTGALLSGLAFLLSLVVAARVAAEGVVSIGPEEFLRADGLSAILLLIVTGVAWVAMQFGAGEDALGRRYLVLSHTFVFTMLLAVLINNLGIMWVAIEATTIATAFLVGLHRTRSALEASWKYILIGSVGIALAFIGTVLSYFNFVQRIGDLSYALHWTVLSRVAAGLDPDVTRLAFVFLLVGYGTKAGLAPMHTWLPDAHSEAPATISAMMSGSLLAVAFYAILRFKVVADICIGTSFTDHMLILTSVTTVAVAATLLARQANYKRMLAYSSVEHMGLMCLGSALGSLGLVASLLHALTHAASKSMVFLLSGRIRERYGTTRIGSVRGLLRSLPWSGPLFAGGVLALLGLPPFGVFTSEMLLLRAGFLAGRPFVTGTILALLVFVFISMLGHLNRMLYGEPPEKTPAGEDPRRLWPLAVNAAVLLVLGVVVPGPLMRLLDRAAGIVAP
ncbi:MAG TPA: proton-conducting transporter membrane subunit [Candidatus Dormibacteraeota bacterium]|nr:proton-conducting transporter membrane subunit [Candidatus Dormibacteraeota bacterium]